MITHCLPIMPPLCLWCPVYGIQVFYTLVSDSYRNEKSDNALLGCSAHFLANVHVGYCVVLPTFPI